MKKGQFSPWNKYTGYAGGEQGKDMLNYEASEASYKAARDILSGNYEDPTKGATHYVNDKVSKPKWLGAMKNRKRGTMYILEIICLVMQTLMKPMTVKAG